MSTLFARAMLVIVLLFGATSGAYAMADNSLPNEPLYGAKLAMERVQLRMQSDPADVLQLLLRIHAMMTVFCMLYSLNRARAAG